jgi:hypothetical protein
MKQNFVSKIYQIMLNRQLRYNADMTAFSSASQVNASLRLCRVGRPYQSSVRASAERRLELDMRRLKNNPSTRPSLR